VRPPRLLYMHGISTCSLWGTPTADVPAGAMRSDQCK
jgi:hypothetical protein